MVDACTRLGKLRRRPWEGGHGEADIPADKEVDGTDQKSTFNALVVPMTPAQQRPDGSAGSRRSVSTSLWPRPSRPPHNSSLKAITSADLVLADKLVPAPVLELVPRRVTVYIARKFPGNADKVQEELLSLSLSGLQRGLDVLRLKQGGGARIPLRTRISFCPYCVAGNHFVVVCTDVCLHTAHVSWSRDQVLICTGTGRKGASRL
jgi:uroporphyrin-III C-methyltransferase